MATTYQIWTHIRSGEKFVVEVDEYGSVVDAGGPLHHSEIEAALRDGPAGDPELAAAMNDWSFDYRRTDA